MDVTMQVVIIILLFSGGTEAVPLDSFYKFGLEAGDTLLPPGEQRGTRTRMRSIY